MRPTIEAYFLLNFAVDAALIAVSAAACGCFRGGRVLLGGILAALYSVAVEVVSPALAHPAVQISLAVVLSLIVCGTPEPSRWGSFAFHTLCAAFLLGGFGHAFSLTGDGGLPAVLIPGLLVLHLFLREKARRITAWEVTVCVRLHGSAVSFRALIDTGNRLREPISGLPVLIAEETLLRKLPIGCASVPCRRISFGGLGGCGTVSCFRPDSVLVRSGGRMIEAPDVWIALYPGRMPGVNRALAPPSFAAIPGKSS